MCFSSSADNVVSATADVCARAQQAPHNRLTAVGAVLVVGDDVLVALRLEPAADAEGVLGAADEVGVAVGVLAALVEDAHDLLAAGGRLAVDETNRTTHG